MSGKHGHGSQCILGADKTLASVGIEAGRGYARVMNLVVALFGKPHGKALNPSRAELAHETDKRAAIGSAAQESADPLLTRAVSFDQCTDGVLYRRTDQIRGGIGF